MSATWGKNIRYSIFGESHGNGIGMLIDGLPSGIKLDFEYIKGQMDRRAPGRGNLSTTRQETDIFQILSGYFNNATTGTPLCIVIPNKDTKSKDYDKLREIMRPGHADYTGYIKYNGFNDYRGGGHFSGRLTAPLVFAGAVAQQLLSTYGVSIVSHISSIFDINDSAFDSTEIEEAVVKKLKGMDFPVIDDEAGNSMKRCIREAKEQKDSVGGVIEVAVLNLPPGLGEPYFDSVESSLAHLLFSIPSVKAVEFGAGFQLGRMKGSEANDNYYIENGKIRTSTNNNGGILGGITNGMPLIFRCAFKPTPSIGKTQRTINITTMEETDLNIHGRHDPCILTRAIPVVEAAAAMAVLEFLIQDRR